MPILVILLLLISCTTRSPESDKFNRVSYKAAKKIERNFPLECTCIGTSNRDSILFYRLTFDYSNPMNVSEGRYIMVNCINIALETFQKDPQMQNLQDKSFNINNFIIYLYSKEFAFSETPPELLSGLLFLKGVIEYRRYNPLTDCLETIYEETYEEALQKCPL